MRNAVFFLLLLLSWIPSYAQISGRVTDSSGQPLPFASIYIQGTSVGSTSNAEGYYKLEPKVFPTPFLSFFNTSVLKPR
ncbi:MAG: carboxypeptidase-like regulatory domain-containing protein [Saprospirales bacterium]|nr:carboxypeptidase-like regulatory domain-containing protein [Saprospirales bacterium]